MNKFYIWPLSLKAGSAGVIYCCFSVQHTTKIFSQLLYELLLVYHHVIYFNGSRKYMYIQQNVASAGNVTLGFFFTFLNFKLIRVTVSPKL